MNRNLCRICLARKDETFLDILTPISINDEEINLISVLNLVGGLNFENQTKESLWICLTCTDEALTSFKFRIKCQNSTELYEKSLNSQPPEMETNCNEHIDVKVEEMKEINFQDSGIIENDMSEFYQVTQHEIDRSGIPDDIIIFSGENGRYYFFKHANDAEDGDTKLVSLVESEGELYEKLLVKQEPRKVTYQCNECPEIFDCEDALHYHLFDEHALSKFECSACGDKYKNEVDMMEHIATHKRFTCHNCMKQYIIVMSDSAHVNTEETLELEMCNACKKKLDQASKRRTQLKDAKHICHICGMFFKSRKNAQNHLDKHEAGLLTPNNKQFICDICEGAFVSRFQIETHIWGVHFDKRPFKCQYCEKRFRTKGTLKGHQVVHTRERNYHCKYCNMGLVDRRALKQHLNLHENRKPHSCEECGRSFVTLARLNVHKKTSHSKPKKKCPLCPALFHLKSMLHSHVRKVHLGENGSKKRRMKKRFLRVNWEVEQIPLEEMNIPKHLLERLVNVEMKEELKPDTEKKS